MQEARTIQCTYKGPLNFTGNPLMELSTFVLKQTARLEPVVEVNIKEMEKNRLDGTLTT
jgi:hypothetical protein